MKSKEMNTLVEALMLLRKDYPDMTLTQAIAFIMLGQEEEISHSDLIKKLGISFGTLSRIIDRLSDGKTGTLVGKGLNYVKSIRGAGGDDRRISIHLTKKGALIQDELLAILQRS